MAKALGNARVIREGKRTLIWQEAEAGGLLSDQEPHSDAARSSQAAWPEDGRQCKQQLVGSQTRECTTRIAVTLSFPLHGDFVRLSLRDFEPLPNTITHNMITVPNFNVLSYCRDQNYSGSRNQCLRSC